jgi:AcrR family transcriptional regulator
MTAAGLPRGRHHLSRADVAGRQRTRILEALADVLTERGYAATPVAAVIERAGVSRETFYQQFASKQDCFIAALEVAVGELATSLTAALETPGRTPLERYDAMLDSYLGTLAAHPARARLFLIETYAAGPEAMRRRLELQQQFVDGLAWTFGARTRAARFGCEALVGATVSLVTARFVTGELHELATLRPALVVLAGTLLSSRKARDLSP